MDKNIFYFVTDKGYFIMRCDVLARKHNLCLGHFVLCDVEQMIMQSFK